MSQPPGSQQPYYPQQPTPQFGTGSPAGAPVPQRKRRAPLVLGIVGAFVVLLVIAAAMGGGTAGTPADAPAVGQAPAEQQPPAAVASDKIVLVYEVTGAGSAANISYIADGVASTEQATDVQLPWSKTIELDAAKAFSSSLVAQAGAGTTEIAAKITANGQVLKEGKSSGQYAVVTVVGELYNLGK